MISCSRLAKGLKRFGKFEAIGYECFLREAEAGLAVGELCHRHGFSEVSYDLWHSKFGVMSVSDAKRLNELEVGHSDILC